MNITTENIDQYLFEYVEGNLSGDQEEALFSFIELRPEYLKDLQAWNQTVVKSHTNDTFGYNKSKLVRGIWKLKYLFYAVPVLITFSALFYFMGYQQGNSIKTSSEEKVVATPVSDAMNQNALIESAPQLSEQEPTRHLEVKSTSKANRSVNQQISNTTIENSSNKLSGLAKKEPGVVETKQELRSEEHIELLRARPLQLMTENKPLAEPKRMPVQRPKPPLAKKKNSYSKKKGPGVVPLKIKGF